MRSPVGGVSVETEEDGPTLVELFVRDATGTPFTGAVNASTKKVEEIEKGIEEHHELEEEEEYEQPSSME